MNDEAKSLAGWVPDCVDESALFDALEKAFDYRGDVTLTLRDGGVVSGYLFDRERGEGLGDSAVRVMPSDGGEVVRVGYGEIARLEFDRRDPAAGKTWENWLKRYAKAKLAGEKAGIYGDEAEG